MSNLKVGTTLMSDKRLREMHGLGKPAMIVPFVDHQVRVDKDGKRIISYGTSSYGYDVRCSNEFKIFTNVHSTVVDPKNFDEKCFVEHVGDICIIPPNSFALARTVEYFYIPKNVITVCLGKSTYARCFSGRTRVALANGTSVTFKEMAKRAASGERFFGYGMSPSLGVVVTELVSPRKISSGERLLRVTLDSGETIDCTPDHKFLTRKGTYVEAAQLTTGRSLMPLYRNVVRGREVVYNPENKKCGGWWRSHTYRLSDAWNLRNGVYEEEFGQHRHHIDENKRNDYPTNILRKDAEAHIKDHNEDYFGGSFDPRAHSRAIKKTLKSRKKNQDWVANMSLKNKERSVKYWSTVTREELGVRSEKLKARWTLKKRKTASARMLALWRDPDYLLKMKTRNSRPRTAFDTKLAKSLLKKTRSVKDTASAVGVSAGVLARALPEQVNRIRAMKGLPPVYPQNHKVLSVEKLPGRHDVYCLTVPETGNFALEAGVFVKNCGVVVNVTPFEPGWEGHVTLEFSNTTPLPAMIYAGEGCAQVLFFENEEHCEVSYKDRDGKYQGQTGVTLPKT